MLPEYGTTNRRTKYANSPRKLSENERRSLVIRHANNENAIGERYSFKRNNKRRTSRAKADSDGGTLEAVGWRSLSGTILFF
jgi:hypothetical protein